MPAGGATQEPSANGEGCHVSQSCRQFHSKRQLEYIRMVAVPCNQPLGDDPERCIACRNVAPTAFWEITPVKSLKGSGTRDPLRRRSSTLGPRDKEGDSNDAGGSAGRHRKVGQRA